MRHFVYPQAALLCSVFCFDNIPSPVPLAESLGRGDSPGHILTSHRLDPVGKAAGLISNIVIGAPEECKEILENFSNASARFTRCATNFTKPASMCRLCVSHLIDVKEYFFQFEHSKADGVNCKDLASSRDKVDIISTTYEFIAGPRGLWSKGSCSACYTQPLDRNTSMTEPANKFFEMYEMVMDCFHKYPPLEETPLAPVVGQNRSVACEDCSVVYYNLSEYYRSLNADYPNLESICFDILDAMNSTQQRWGTGQFGCGRELSFNLPLVIAIACVCLSTTLFYLAIRYSYGGGAQLERVVSLPHISHQVSRSEHWNDWSLGRDTRLQQAGEDSYSDEEEIEERETGETGRVLFT